MASTAIHEQPQGHSTTFEPLTPSAPAAKPPAPQRHHVPTSLNYYRDPGDGSEPAPAYVGKPESYELPTEALPVTVRDIRGEEAAYSLDGQGFQIYGHTSAEKSFDDEERIKAEYYPETEQLLKDAYVVPPPSFLPVGVRRDPTHAWSEWAD